jgi:hypothetical protein
VYCVCSLLTFNSLAAAIFILAACGVASAVVGGLTACVMRGPMGASTLRRDFQKGRHHELKRRAAGHVGGRPQSSAMRFDD